MGNEFENREQRRKMKKSRAKSGKAKATRATAVMMEIGRASCRERV